MNTGTRMLSQNNHLLSDLKILVLKGNNCSSSQNAFRKQAWKETFRHLLDTKNQGLDFMETMQCAGWSGAKV